MSSIPIIEGETSEQRRARMAQAAIGHARRKAAMRAEEAAQGRLLSNPFAVMPEMQPVPEMPPGYADYLQRPVVSSEMPEIEVRGVMPPMPVPSATDYIASMLRPPLRTVLDNAPPMPVVPPLMAQPDGMPPFNIEDYPSRGVIDNRIGPNFGKPMQPDAKSRFGDMLRGIGSMMPQMQPMMPMDRGMSPPPGFGLDDNANRPTVNREFNALRERYADQGLRAAINEYYRGGSVMRYR